MKQLWQRFLFYTFLVIRRFIYLGLFVFGTILPRNKVVVLCYHSVGNDDWRYGVDMASLKRQMLHMLAHYTPVTLDEVVAYARGEINFKKPVFAVTFDDGYADILQTVDMFQHYGIHPAAFILADRAHANVEELGADRQFMNTEEIVKLHKLGWTIGCHSATHTDFYSLDAAGAEREVVESKAWLESETRLPVKYFAYPKGRYTDVVLQSFEKAGYTAGFSMDDRLVRKGIDTRIIPRIGVDRTHTYLEFEATISLPAVFMRSVVKQLDKWNTLRKKEAV